MLSFHKKIKQNKEKAYNRDRNLDIFTLLYFLFIFNEDLYDP
jgi:hypothetical protein